MKTRNFIRSLLFALATATVAGAATNPGAVFTYQGQLMVFGEGGPANGLYDMQWTLMKTETNGTPHGSSMTTSNVCVSNGLFSVELDLDVLAPVRDTWTPVDTVWIDILVRRSGSTEPFRSLDPRQRLTAAPRADHARVAGTVPDGAITETKLGAKSVKSPAIDERAVEEKHLADGAATDRVLADMSVTMSKVAMGAIMMEHIADGAVGRASLADGGVTGEKISAGAVVRGLNGLRDDVNLVAGDGILIGPPTILGANGDAKEGGSIPISAIRTCTDYTNCYWNLLGNGNITAGVNFLGTVAGELDPLEFRVNNDRTMLYVFTGPNTSPNIIGGFKHNIVNGVGGTIAGGGRANAMNVIKADWGTIGGGYTNVIDTGAISSTIVGGYNNFVQNAVGGSIGGGNLNRLLAGTHFGTIAGGSENNIDGQFSGIGAGLLNSIRSGAMAAYIGGGSNNVIYQGAFATIGGGLTNSILNYSEVATIGGGALNSILYSSGAGTIGGGQRNLISSNVYSATIAGGANNIIEMAAFASAVAGGFLNRISPYASYGAVSGGYSNRIHTNAQYATVGGGDRNTAGATWSTVSGGVNNWAGGVAASVGGGNLNVASGGDATVAGGRGNSASSAGASVGGGADNESSAEYAAIAGGLSNAIVSGANYAAQGGGYGNTIQSGGSSATIAGGWLNFIDGQAGSIGGGEGNRLLVNSDYCGIGAGRQNTISNAWYAQVGGGRGNSIQYFADNSTVAGGYNNVVDANATSGTIGGGYGNVIATNADYATIAGGRLAKAVSYGQNAYASGQFAAAGDAQSSLYVLRRTTTTNTPTELFLDGGAQRMRVPPDATWAFDILIIGRTSGTFSAGYHIRGTIENNGGTVALEGTPLIDILNEDVAGWDATVLADNVNDALVIQVTGGATDTVRWVAKVRTVEVTFP